jgi:hypothetical protein
MRHPPAEITERFSLPGTHGPVDRVAQRCAAGHHCRMPVDLQSAERQEQIRRHRCAEAPVTATGPL